MAFLLICQEETQSFAFSGSYAGFLPTPLETFRRDYSNTWLLQGHNELAVLDGNVHVCLSVGLVSYGEDAMTVNSDIRAGTYPEVQRAKALLEGQEQRRRAGINRHYDREVEAIAIYRSRGVYFIQ